MVSQIRVGTNTTGTLHSWDYGHRFTFSLSNGNALVIVRDNVGTNLTTERFLVYESTDRVAWTLRATVTPQGTDGVFMLTATVDAANNLHMVYTTANRRLVRYATVTYGTWAISAWSSVTQVLPAGAVWTDMDIDVSDSGRPFVGVVYWYGNNGPYGWCGFFLSTASGWQQTLTNTVHNKPFVPGCQTISVYAISDADVGGVTYTRVGVAFGYSETTPEVKNAQGKVVTAAKYVDQGVKLYSYHIRPTTGALYEPNPGSGLRGTVCAGQGNPKSTVVLGRIARFFHDPDDSTKVILGIMHAEVNRLMYAVRLDHTNGLQQATPQQFMNNSIAASSIAGRYMAITYAGGTLMFMCSPPVGSFGGVRALAAYTARLTSTKDAFLFQSRLSWFTLGGYVKDQSIDMISSGGHRNGQSTKADVYYHTQKSATVQRFYHEYAQLGAAVPKKLSPATGSTTTSSNPAVSGYMDHDRLYMQVASGLEFQFATSADFTASAFTVRSAEFDVIDNTDKNDGSIITLILPSSYTLAAGQTWYMRARNLDSFGNVGPWTDSVNFTVAHPPSASNLSPNGNKGLPWGGSGKIDFKWDFTDPSSTDTQTAYRLRIYNRDTGVNLLDTGKVASTNRFASIQLPNAAKNINLEWDISLWDSYDTQGAYSARAGFAVYDGPTVAITAPVQGSTVATPVVSIDFTVGTAGGATVKNYRVTASQGGVVRWDSGQINANNAASGSSFHVQSPSAVYRNNQSYTLSVTVTDSRDIQTISAPRMISALWAPPPMPTTYPTVNVDSFDNEEQGYVQVTWDDSGKDAEFVMYSLQRKDDLIHPSTQEVLRSGEWKEIAQIFDNDPTYTYLDYLAPSGYKVSYRVAQGVARFNDIVYSEGGPAAPGYPVSSAYWLVDPDFGGTPEDAFKLHNITSESFTEEYERNEYLVVGKGMHVDIGERKGYAGTMTAQVRDSGLTTARQKRLRLEELQGQARSLYFRNPFGDVFRVSCGDLAISRIAGVGLSEFFDLTIPYQEVGE